MKYNETEGLTASELEFVRYLVQQRDNEVRDSNRWIHEEGFIQGFIAATLMSPYRPKELTNPVLGDSPRNFLATSLSWNAYEPGPKLAEQDKELDPVAYRVPLDVQILTVAAFPEGLRAVAKRIVENPAEKLTEEECRRWARDLLADADMKEPPLPGWNPNKEIGCTTAEASYYREVLREVLPLSFHDDIPAREETQSDFNRALAAAREVFKRVALPIDQYIWESDK